MIRAILGLFTGPVLDKVFRTIDMQIAAQSDKDRLRAEVIKAHYVTRADWMRAGGFVLMMLFAVPLAFWFAAVTVYSVFWCAGCAFPRDWAIAALPPPLDEWGGMIVLAIFGVIGVSRFGGRS